MRNKVEKELAIPEGVDCKFSDGVFVASKGSQTLSRKISMPSISVETKGNNVIMSCEKANKNDYKKIMSLQAHIKNIFKGLDNKFVFKLEACNVHFPMTLKVENGFLLINNFLGEKVPRRAKILPNVEIDVKGPKITLSSSDIEAAGSTATNIEKATIVRNRDRRVFQDGIFIVEKPGASE